MEQNTPRDPQGPSNVGLFGVLFVLALTAGEYYYLMHPELRTAAITEQQVATSPPGGDPQASSQQEVGANKLNDRMSSLGGGLKQKAVAAAGKVYDPYGVYIRGLLLITSVLTALIMKPPVPRPGQPKRKKPTKQVVHTTVIVCSVLGAAAGYLLLTVTRYPLSFLEIGYPVAGALVMGAGFLAGAMRATHKRVPGLLSSDRFPKKTQYGVVLPTDDGGFVNVPNPFRGSLVLGGAGAGKTYSIGEPMVEQFAEKQFAGLIYDYKFPVLAEAQQKALVLAQKKIKEERTRIKKSWAYQVKSKLGFTPTLPEIKPPQYHIINFKDMERTHKVNPLQPELMPEISYALEYARTILSNLNPASIKNRDFFTISSEAFLTAIIWFYKKNFPMFCTIPHVVNTALFKDFRHVLAMLETDTECAQQARSLITAVEQKAEKQVAAVVSSLQIALNRINTPQITWVLTPNVANNEGFSLMLNDPKNPAVLCIGNDPTLQETFSPVIACVIAVSLKLMNQQHRHPSYVFLDEAATIYVPGLETIPATARSNKVALVYMTQDLSQMIDAYGREKMQVMVSNLNNQFFGKVNSLETAKFISELVGKEDREMGSVSTGESKGSKNNGSSKNRSVSYQERSLVRVQDTITLEQGEFIGQTVETDSSFFQAKITRREQPGKYPLAPITVFDYGHEALRPTTLPAETVTAAQPHEKASDWREERRRQTQRAVVQNVLDAKEAVILANAQMVTEEVQAIISNYKNRFETDAEHLEQTLSR